MNEQAEPPGTIDAADAVSRALVVDDNRTNQTIVAAILQSLDFNISTAENGAEAVEMARAGQFDIILMDIHMPVLDGFKATRQIRDLGGWCASVPIIAVTANEMAKDRATYVAAGLDDLVPKPIDARFFAETVLRHMDKTGD